MYIILRARPWPRRNRNRLLFSPVFALVCPPPFRLKFTSVTNSQPCHWSHAGPAQTASLRLASHPLSLSLSHTHTLSLSRSLSLSLALSRSLSLSLCGSGITTTHTAPHPAPRAFSLWDVARKLILSHFRTRARTPTPQYITDLRRPAIDKYRFVFVQSTLCARLNADKLSSSSSAVLPSRQRQPRKKERMHVRKETKQGYW